MSPSVRARVFVTGALVAAIGVPLAPTATADASTPPPGPALVETVRNPGGPGWWALYDTGRVDAYGGAPVLGSPRTTEHRPFAGLAAVSTGSGYWLAARDGAVYAFGTSRFYGSLTGRTSSPVTDITATLDGRGYILRTADGRDTGFGSAAPTVHAESAGQAQPAATEPSDADFDRLAQCESSGRWDIDTGNGYYGGLQFSAATWQYLGGTGLPNQHTRLEQIDIGRRQWRRSGWSAWPACSQAIGLS